MGTTSSQDKKPTEKIRLSADFTSSLLVGETIQSAQISVTCVNAITGASTPSILLGSPTLSGNIIRQVVQGGLHGEVYRIAFKTGSTTLSLAYETELNLVITDSPTADTPLATRDEIKRRLKITDNSEDALLDDLNLASSAYIRRRTGRDFTLSTYTEVLQPAKGDSISRVRLYHYPVVSVDSIKITLYDGATVYEYTSADDWDFVPEGYLWFTNFENTFYTFPDKNEIVYKAGFPHIPEDVKDACVSLVTAAYRSIGREGLSEERIGDYLYRTALNQQEFPGVMRRELQNRQVEGVIARYRRIELDIQE